MEGVKAQKHDKKKYSGQALAIVLIILVVGVIIALALVSRSIKAQKRVVEEKRSSEAQQVVKSINKVASDTSGEDMVNKVLSNLTSDAARASFNSGTEVCFINADIDKLFGLTTTSVTFPTCAVGGTGDSQSKICVKKVFDYQDGVVIDKDAVLSLPLSYSTIPGCSMQYSFSMAGGNAEVIMSEYYSQTGATSTTLKPYEPDDIKNYCIGDNSNCSILSSGTYNWTTATTYTMNLSTRRTYNSVNYDPYELRIRAVSNPVRVVIQATPTGCSSAMFIRVTTTANCSGDFQGTYYDLPIRPGASPIFDYVLFNGQGNLTYQE